MFINIIYTNIYILVMFVENKKNDSKLEIN